MIPEDLHISRQGYLDEFGDWYSSNRWLGTFEVHPSIDYRLRVWAELHVWGEYRSVKGHKRRCYPVEWRILLRMDRITHYVTAPTRCKSLKDAKAQASRIDLTPHVKSILRTFYDPKKAICVWLKANRPSQWDLIAHDGWVPHVTHFMEYDYVGFASGDYTVIRKGSASRVHRNGTSMWSQGGGPENDKLVSLLPNWLTDVPDTGHLLG